MKKKMTEKRMIFCRDLPRFNIPENIGSIPYEKNPAGRMTQMKISLVCFNFGSSGDYTCYCRATEGMVDGSTHRRGPIFVEKNGRKDLISNVS